MSGFDYRSILQVSTSSSPFLPYKALRTCVCRGEGVGVKYTGTIYKILNVGWGRRWGQNTQLTLKVCTLFFCLLWGLEHRNQPRWRTSAFIGYHYAYQQWQRVHCTQFRTEPKGENLFSLSKVKPDRSAQSLLIVLSKIRDCHFQSYIYDAVLQSIPDQSMCFQSFT